MLAGSDALEVAAGATVMLSSSAVQTVTATGGAAGSVPIDATDCLLGSVQCDATATLVYCTVLGATSATALRASDCIFVGAVTVSGAAGCVRYSRVPGDLPSGVSGRADTTTAPVFLQLPTCAGSDRTPQVPGWGQPGCGVLDTAAAQLHPLRRRGRRRVGRLPRVRARAGGRSADE